MQKNKRSPQVFALVGFLSLLSWSVSARAEPCTAQTGIPSAFLRFQSYPNQSSDCSIMLTSEPRLSTEANRGKRDYSTADRLRLDHRGALVITTTEELPNEERISRITGTRTFLFFPRVTSLAVQPQPSSGTVDLRLLNGETLRFDSATGRIRDYSGGEVREAEAIVLTNQGGVEFGPPRSGLILDCGWAKGRVAFESKTGQCTFRDRHGHTCSRPNSELFSEVRNPQGALLDNRFRFPNDEELASYLRQSCAGLDPDWREPIQTSRGSSESRMERCALMAPASPSEVGPIQDQLHDILPKLF